LEYFWAMLDSVCSFGEAFVCFLERVTVAFLAFWLFCVFFSGRCNDL